jgi:hypothetical protein
VRPSMPLGGVPGVENVSLNCLFVVWGNVSEVQVSVNRSSPYVRAGRAFLVGLVVSSAVVSNLFIVVRDTIHRPGNHRIVEAQPWFSFFDRHHYIHHIDLGANVNFLLPLADLVFGTLRTELTADELEGHGPLEVAKARLVGEGERVPSL